MQATSGTSATWVFPALVSAAVVATVALGIKIPLLSNGRAAFFTLAIFGSQLCGLAFRVPPGTYAHGWLNPFTVAGIVLGAFNLVLVGSVLFHYRLPFVSTVQAATLTLGTVMGIKVVLAMLRSALGKRRAGGNPPGRPPAPGLGELVRRVHLHLVGTGAGRAPRGRARPGGSAGLAGHRVPPEPGAALRNAAGLAPNRKVMAFGASELSRLVG